MQKKITVWIILVALMISAFPSDTFAAPNPVKNVIIVMPDGLGATHAATTRWYQNGQKLAADEMISGAIQTYNAESLISDSAPVLVVEKGLKRAEMPISKNIIKMTGKSYETNGLTILAVKTGKVYVPQQAVDIVMTGLQ